MQRPAAATLQAIFLALLAWEAFAQATEFEACGVLEPLVGGAAASGAEADRGACSGRLTGGSAFDASGCPRVFNPFEGLEFDAEDPKHRLWYERFWTGRCDGLGLFDFCTESGGGWPDTVEKIAARADEEDRPRLRAELWAIGRMIGFEWARDNAIRRISTSDALRMAEELEGASDPWRGLRRVCGEARATLGISAR